jgi:hypothetical protein
MFCEVCQGQLVYLSSEFSNYRPPWPHTAKAYVLAHMVEKSNHLATESTTTATSATRGPNETTARRKDSQKEKKKRYVQTNFG